MKANRMMWLFAFTWLVLASASKGQGDNPGTTNSLRAKRVSSLAPQEQQLDANRYRKAADQGDARAQYILGLCYFHGEGVAKDAVEGLKWWRKAADQGDAEAQYQVGLLYRDGDVVAKDATEAMKWLRKAANQGDAKAQYEIALYYRYGKGVAKDAAEAVKWLQRAADQGDALGQYALGDSYFEGDGVPQNYAEALKWFRKAAGQGNIGGQTKLGWMYYNGQGMSRDAVESVKWYRKAAEQGDAISQNNLGFSYAEGEGVAKDPIEAVRWYRKAAEQGFAGAQSALGSCYGNGTGVRKDYLEAYKWLNLASAQGIEVAKQNLSIIEILMTPEQIAEGQQLAREFKAPNKSAPKNFSSRNNPKASGTGFFISDDGYLISNHHVVEGANQVRLVTSAGLISAKVVKVDAANDLALLKAEGKFSALPVAASRGVKMGGTVVTVGFPNIGLQGFAPKLAKGEIASLSGAGDDARYFQISVPVQPGNSGGALVDERGNVVGVVSAKLNASAALRSSGALPENVNYAVKSSYLLSFLESVPDVANTLKEASTKEKKFEDVVKEAEQAAVLVLVY